MYQPGDTRVMTLYDITLHNKRSRSNLVGRNRIKQSMKTIWRTCFRFFPRKRSKLRCSNLERFIKIQQEIMERPHNVH